MAARKLSVDVSAEIQRATARFAAEIQEILERLAADRNAEVIQNLESVKAMLGGHTTPTRRAGKAPAATKKTRRGRVSSQEAQEVVFQALQGVGAPVGMARLTQATKLGVSSVRGALKVLREQGVVGTEGDKRSTVYFTADTAQGAVEEGTDSGKTGTGRRSGAKKARRSKRK